jgi:HAD superfamily 5'-nucleotidase-like hydrolase
MPTDLPVSFTPLEPELRSLVGVSQPLLNPARAVYTNRDTDLSQIRLVGFDMDYTLAIYKKLPMEQLQYDLTLERLIDKHGYPESIRELQYDPGFIVRGLTVDKRTGQLLKTDTHGSVSVCYRGRRRLDLAEIAHLYKHAKIRLQSATFASIDTLFALPEACLYANLVEFFDERHQAKQDLAPVALPENHQTPNLGPFDTWKLFDDVRAAIDDIHRDGTLKTIIMGELSTYIEQDEGLALSLHKLRSAGKKLFVLTNSYWTYTDAVMTYLLHGRLKEYTSWRAYFDIVIVGGRKPRFFTEREPFLELDTQAEDGQPGIVGEVTGDKFERGRAYQGGNIEAFERMCKCAGEEILYVGDHIFGDILRSKKDSRWRTCLIVEELEREIAGFFTHAKDVDALAALDAKRHAVDDAIGQQRALLAELELCATDTEGRGIEADLVPRLEDAAKRLRKEIDQAKRELRGLDENGRALQENLEKRFNPSWGRLLKSNNELSRFGGQITYYADTYTSRVSNFLQYSPVHYFRAPRELMSHDRSLMDSDLLQRVLSLEMEARGEPSPGEVNADAAVDAAE